MGKRAISSIFLPLLLVIAGLAVYSNAFTGPFVFDDKLFIVDNEWIKALSNFVRPVGMRYVGDLSFALNFHFNGLDTFGYHLVNIVIHIANSVLLYFFIMGLFRTPAISRAADVKGGFTPEFLAFPVAALFLAHPIQIQAVTYISQRYASLAVFFYLSAVLCFLYARSASSTGARGPRSLILYIAAFVSTVLAMKTKEISFTIPFMMLAIDIALFGRGFGRKRLLSLVPFFAAALIIPVALILPEFGMMQTGSGVEELMRVHKLEEAGGISRIGYLLTQSKVVVTYIRLFLFPVHRGFIYHFPIEKSIADPAVLTASVALLIIIALTVYLFLRSIRSGNLWGLLASLGLVWFFVTLSVESSVIPIKDAFNERRLYLPSIGLSLAFVSALFYAREFLYSRFALRLSALAIAAFVLIAVAAPFGAVTHARNGLWNDELVLYAEEARKSPYSSSTHMYLGLEYYKRGERDKALAEFIAAKKLNPSTVYVRRMLSNYYVKTGDYAAAIRETAEILELEPDNKEARYNLGVLYMSVGRLDEAAVELNRYLEQKPGDALAIKALERLERMRSKPAITRHEG